MRRDSTCAFVQPNPGFVCFTARATDNKQMISDLEGRRCLVSDRTNERGDDSTPNNSLFCKSSPDRLCTMIPPTQLIAAVALTLVTVGSLLGGDSKQAKPSVGGTVIGENGKPSVDAEIRALRVDVKAPLIVARTDSTGRYAMANLPVGSYSLTACVDGFPLSRANIRTQGRGWTKVDFDLRLATVEGMGRMQGEVSLHSFAATVKGNPH